MHDSGRENARNGASLAVLAFALCLSVMVPRLALAEPVVGKAERLARIPAVSTPQCVAQDGDAFLVVVNAGRPVLQRFSAERGTLLSTISLRSSGMNDCQIAIATLNQQKQIVLIGLDDTFERARLFVMNESGQVRLQRDFLPAPVMMFGPQLSIRDRWIYYAHDGNVRTLELETGREGPSFDFGRRRNVRLWDEPEGVYAVVDEEAWTLDASVGMKHPAPVPVREKIYQDGLGQGPSRPLRLPSGNYVQLRIAVTLLDPSGKLIAKQPSDGVIDNHVRFRTDSALFLAPDGVRVLANRPTTLYRVRIGDNAPPADP